MKQQTLLLGSLPQAASCAQLLALSPFCLQQPAAVASQVQVHLPASCCPPLLFCLEATVVLTLAQSCASSFHGLRSCQCPQCPGSAQLAHLGVFSLSGVYFWCSLSRVLAISSVSAGQIFALPSAVCLATKELNLLWGTVILSSFLGDSVTHCAFKWVSPQEQG